MLPSSARPPRSRRLRRGGALHRAGRNAAPGPSPTPRPRERQLGADGPGWRWKGAGCGAGGGRPCLGSSSREPTSAKWGLRVHIRPLSAFFRVYVASFAAWGKGRAVRPAHAGGDANEGRGQHVGAHRATAALGDECSRLGRPRGLGARRPCRSTASARARALLLSVRQAGRGAPGSRRLRAGAGQLRGPPAAAFGASGLGASSPADSPAQGRAGGGLGVFPRPSFSRLFAPDRRPVCTWLPVLLRELSGAGERCAHPRTDSPQREHSSR